jgi:hypothetical protein
VASLTPVFEKDLSMNRLTNAQAVASGAASLILFSTTLFAGYALAGGLLPASGLARDQPVHAVR